MECDDERRLVWPTQTVGEGGPVDVHEFDHGRFGQTRWITNLAASSWYKTFSLWKVNSVDGLNTHANHDGPFVPGRRNLSCMSEVAWRFSSRTLTRGIVCIHESMRPAFVGFMDGYGLVGQVRRTVLTGISTGRTEHIQNHHQNNNLLAHQCYHSTLLSNSTTTYQKQRL